MWLQARVASQSQVYVSGFAASMTPVANGPISRFDLWSVSAMASDGNFHPESLKGIQPEVSVGLRLDTALQQQRFCRQARRVSVSLPEA